MKKYPAYKDSGIEWIGEIPEHWNMRRLKYFAQIRNGKDQKEVLEENGRYPIYGSGGVFGRSKEYLYDKPSILLGRKGTVDKPLFVDEPFWSVDTMYYTEISNDTDPKFFFYLAKTIKFDYYQYGSAVPSMTQQDLNEIQFQCPTLQEQTTIANYLDRKTAEIDTLIEKKKQLIAMYKEERMATINHTVTKGLDPDLPMKDSGIEWIGDIPEHWEVKRVDWVSNVVRGNCTFKRDELLNNGEYVALQYGKTYKVDVVDDNFKFFVNSEFYKENQIVSRGDTIMISTSETIEDLGHTCYYDNENIGLIGGEQILLKPNCEILNEKYLFYYTRQLGSLLRKYAKGLKVYRFNTNDLKQVFFAIPPKQEQEIIANFLGEKTVEIDGLVSKSEQEITLLEEYKTALISEVVLGKVDVREEALN